MRWPAGFEPDHEGYYGTTTAQVCEKVTGSLPQAPAPDVALIYVGTNDKLGETVDPLAEIVRQLRARNRGINVYVGLLALQGRRGVSLAS